MQISYRLIIRIDGCSDSHLHRGIIPSERAFCRIFASASTSPDSQSFSPILTSKERSHIIQCSQCPISNARESHAPGRMSSPALSIPAEPAEPIGPRRTLLSPCPRKLGHERHLKTLGAYSPNSTHACVPLRRMSTIE
ncbi:hypothetical protein ONS96_001079 [Cadophora gregata f. sp. sojae]|nr:hypothetical protein ONS96_001079 [Cadophora gregata f. sp. sojae]